MLPILKKIELKIINKFVGVDIILDGNKLFFSYIVIKRIGNSIHIEESAENLSDFALLKEKKLHVLPLLISINGKGIIHKSQLYNSVETSEIKILSQIIPGFDPSNLYFQIITDDINKETYISVIRKEQLNNIIKSLKELGFYVIDLLLGPYSVINLCDLLEKKPIVTSNYTITLNNTLKIELEHSNNISSHIIGDDTISGNLISAFGIAASRFYKKPNIICNYDDLIIDCREEYTYLFLFRKIVPIALIIIFTTLFVNFLVFNKYTTNLMKAESILHQNKESIAKITKLSIEISKKEKYISSNSLVIDSRISYYADRIALLVPNDMTLNELIIFPVKNELKDKEEILYEQNKIIIQGSTTPAGLISFIAGLSEEIWVKKTEVTDYKSIMDTRFMFFKLELSLKEK